MSARDAGRELVPACLPARAAGPGEPKAVRPGYPRSGALCRLSWLAAACARITGIDGYYTEPPDASVTDASVLEGPCGEGEVRGCPSSSGLACAARRQSCVGGRWSACAPIAPAGARDCTSSSDNDCNGLADSTEPECECTLGSVRACQLDGPGAPCDAVVSTCVVSSDRRTSSFGPCGLDPLGELPGPRICTDAQASTVLDQCDGATCRGAIADGRVAVGGGYSCAVSPAGALWCWGAVVGAPAALLPAALADLTGVASVSAAAQRWCVLLRSGSVQCSAAFARPTNQGDGKSPGPVVVGGLPTDVVAVGVGERHSCALSGAGTVWCWGSNERGQLGVDGLTASDAPLAVPGIGSASALTVGGSHSCVLLEAGEFRCWGDNDRGQLGDGTVQWRAAPGGVLSAGRGVAVSAALAHTCVLTEQGGERSVQCFGGNGAGELGDGGESGAASPVPHLVPGLDTLRQPFRSVVTGPRRACVLDADGLAVCWGAAFDGTERQLPRPMMGLARLATLSLGQVHGCGLDARAQVWCWGDNHAGALGDASLSPRATPGRVLGLPW